MYSYIFFIIRAEVIGSNRLCDHINNNPVYASCPVDYTNDPGNIFKISNMVSICNAVQVDMFLQINPESFEGSRISGNGGMWDFVVGSQCSPGGKSFICLPSTYKDIEGVLRSRVITSIGDGSITILPLIPHFRYSAKCCTTGNKLRPSTRANSLSKSV